MSSSDAAALAGATIVYTVQSWIDPDKGQKYIDWLTGKHITEVCNEPGVQWARLVRLEQPDDKGWPGYAIHYGFENQAALDAYLVSPARDGFWKELEALNDIHYSTRYWGPIVHSIR